MKKAALVMCLADPDSNPRPNRIIHLLVENGYFVDVLSKPPQKTLGGIRVQMDLCPPVRSYLSKTVRRIRYVALRLLTSVVSVNTLNDYFNDVDIGVLHYRKRLHKEDYDLIMVEDLRLLPLAVRIKGKAQIIFDAREYYPRQNEDSWLFRLFERPEAIRICRQYLRRCDQVLTVSPGLADAYQSEFGIKTTVIMSTPSYREIAPHKTDPQRIRMVHHGGANRNRQIEKMIDIVKLLDGRFSLDLYLTANPAYINDLKAYAKDVPAIRICDPVPFHEIMPMLSRYDIGVFYVEPKTFNLEHCLPNKLFEFIQARLMVAIGPSPDMAAIVRQCDCGVVTESFSVQAMADALNGLDAQTIDIAKQHAHQAAETLCYEVESKKLLALIRNMQSS